LTIQIAGGALFTTTRLVEVAITAESADSMILSNYPDFHGGSWRPYSTTTQHELLEGGGTKVVYARVRLVNGSTSSVASDSIEAAPIYPALRILPDSLYVNHPDVILHMPEVAAREILIAQTDDSSGGIWQTYLDSLPHLFSGPDGWQKTFVWFRNDFFTVGPEVDSIGLDRFLYADNLGWISSGEDTHLEVDDTLQVFLHLLPDAFGIESEGQGFASIPPAIDMISLAHDGEGMYRGIHIVRENENIIDGIIHILFQDRANNQLDDLVADRPVTIYPCAPNTTVGSCNVGIVIRKIAVSGQWAYVAAWSLGLQVVNVANPAVPLPAGYRLTPNFVSDVALSGNYAFVAATFSGLLVMDISIPYIPEIVSSCSTLIVNNVIVRDPYAYVLDSDEDLCVIDISVPTNPTVISSCNTPGSATALSVSGNAAFVGSYWNGVSIVDITDPHQPQRIQQLEMMGTVRSIAAVGTTIFVADYPYATRVINVSDPRNPEVIALIETPGPAWDIAISESYVYIADGITLSVFDISNLPTIVQVGSVLPPVYPHKVTLYGTHAYTESSWGENMKIVCVPR